MDAFRIFLSCVSSEFARARDALAKDLIARGLFVQWQEMFRQEPDSDTLLNLIHDYVRDCQAVICVLGERSGACPPAAAADRYRDMLPDGVTQASYTQWEFFFARHYKRRLSLYRATSPFAPEQTTGSDVSGLQASFLSHIDAAGLHWTPFGSEDRLRVEVLREDWPLLVRAKPIALPYPTLGTLFKGRDDFLVRLRKSVAGPEGQPTVITSNFAIHGLGGIGKTRVAVEYARKHLADYTAALLVVAETPQALETNLGNLAGTLGLTVNDDAKPDAKYAAVLDWLKRNPGWLLILDNVDSPEALKAATALTARLPHGHVLLTCRLAKLPAGIKRLNLDVLTVADATEFLMERTEDGRRHAPDEAAQAALLAEKLGQLALALEHAGAYIVENTCTFADYRARLATSFRLVMDWSDPATTHYPRAIAASWALSVQRLTLAGKSLLERLAFLAPDPVPEFLLDVPVPNVPEQDLREALADLTAYSLVTRDPALPRFSVHRLVLDVTRRGLDPDAARIVLEQALGWVNAAFTGDPGDVRDWPRLDPLAEHAEAVALAAREAGIADPTARLMGALDMLFDRKARYDRAERMSRGALALTEASRGKDHPDLAVRLNNLAQLLQATNRLGEAEPLMRRALAIDEASYGAEHPNVARDLNNLATLLKDTNRLGEAEPLMRRALAIDQASYGAEHPNVAIRLNNLARLLLATNRLTEAEPLTRRATVIFLKFQRATGHPHPHRETALANHAILLRAMGRDEASIAAEQQAMHRESGLA